MTTEAVREIQHALRALAWLDPTLFPLTVDGVYSADTVRAVELFQRRYDLPPTGEVDPITWDRLFEAYRASQLPAPLSLDVFKDNAFRILPGTSHPAIPFIQWILTELSTVFSNIHAPLISEEYNESTQREIRQLQTMHGLNDDGIIDVHTWNILASLYNRQHTILPVHTGVNVL